MPNVASVLKQEIARISKKEAKLVVAPIRKSAVRGWRGVAALKRRIAALEKETKLLRSQMASGPAAAAGKAEQAPRARITVKGVRGLQNRLGLTAEEFGKLLGVTSQAVYNWKKGTKALKLRMPTRQALMSLRGIGRREAQRRLAELAAQKKPAGKIRKSGRRK